jgi:hypothetical protein
MAVAATRVTVEDSATPVFTAGVGGVRVTITNRGNASVFLGPSTVTSTNGYELAQDESLVLHVSPGAVVHGIVASGTQPVHVISA